MVFESGYDAGALPTNEVKDNLGDSSFENIDPGFPMKSNSKPVMRIQKILPHFFYSLSFSLVLMSLSIPG
jgi:hypothetical protein